MMSWQDKLRIIRQAAVAFSELSIVFADQLGADSHFLRSLKNSFRFLDEEYIAFLQATDGLQIDMYHLFGSKQSSLTSISTGIRRWQATIRNDGLPIGEDPSGDCIVFCVDGRIRLVSNQMDRVDEGRVLAESFSDFLTMVLMGPLFPTLFPAGWTAANENEWTRFLRHQGWL